MTVLEVANSFAFAMLAVLHNVNAPDSTKQITNSKVLHHDSSSFNSSYAREAMLHGSYVKSSAKEAILAIQNYKN